MPFAFECFVHLQYDMKQEVRIVVPRSPIFGASEKSRHKFGTLHYILDVCTQFKLLENKHNNTALQ